MQRQSYLAADFPQPTIWDAYFHPVVDSSMEEFEWGAPDLDLLRRWIIRKHGMRCFLCVVVEFPVIPCTNYNMFEFIH